MNSDSRYVIDLYRQDGRKQYACLIGGDNYDTWHY